MASLSQWFKHMWLDASDCKRQLQQDGLRRLEEAVMRSEARHLGELRICIEGGLSFAQLHAGVDARARAIQLFSELRVWDTEQNNGVLIYLLLAEHRIEILADRGVHAVTPQAFWDVLAERLAITLKKDDFEAGLTQAVDEIGHLLHEHYPAAPEHPNPNELPDAVVLL